MIWGGIPKEQLKVWCATVFTATGYAGQRQVCCVKWNKGGLSGDKETSVKSKTFQMIENPEVDSNVADFAALWSVLISYLWWHKQPHWDKGATVEACIFQIFAHQGTKHNKMQSMPKIKAHSLVKSIANLANQNKRRVCPNEPILLLTQHYIAFTHASLLPLEIQGQRGNITRPVKWDTNLWKIVQLIIILGHT